MSKQYKEITPQEADILCAMKIPFQIVVNGVGDYWREWEHGEAGGFVGCLWKPSAYPQDRFRVEVE